MHAPFFGKRVDAWDVIYGTAVFVGVLLAIRFATWIVSPTPPSVRHALCGIERVVVDDPSASEYTFWTRDRDAFVPRVVWAYGFPPTEVREDVPDNRAMCAEWWVRQGVTSDDHSIERIVVHVHHLADVGDGAWTDKHGSHPMHTLR